MKKAITLSDSNRQLRYSGAIWGYESDVNNGIGIISINTALKDEPSFCYLDYKAIAAMLESMENNENVKAVILDINSAGGAVSGLFDLTEYIKKYSKPIVAYTSGLIASAAYGIASATEKIYANESASVGSIGAFARFVDDSKYYEDMGIKEIEFYGKNSEKKNLDPNSEEGKAAYQKEIDDIEDIFISHIAEYRGIDKDTVLDKYGHGLTFLGAEALERGMIDGIVSDFDSLVKKINEEYGMEKKDNILTLATSAEQIDPAFFAEIQNKAVMAERERVSALNAYAELPQPEIKALAEKAKADGTTLADFEKDFNLLAKSLLKEQKAANPMQQLLAAESSDAVDLPVDKAKGELTAQDKVKEIVADMQSKMRG